MLRGMEGELWIDEATFQWVKVQARVIRPVSIEGFLARVEPGTRFELEKMPVADQHLASEPLFDEVTSQNLVCVYSKVRGGRNLLWLSHSLAGAGRSWTLTSRTGEVF